MRNKKPLVFWITGLSGSGKTTLSSKLCEYFKLLDLSPIVLDGDQIREVFFSDLSYSKEARLEVAKFNSKLCKFLALQGQYVICPTISLFREVQVWNKENIPGYVEVFIDAPLSVLKARDPKGIYANSEKLPTKHIVGMDVEAEFPTYPDLCISMDLSTEIQQSADELITFASMLIKNGE